jgi:hypothetical protein
VPVSFQSLTLGDNKHSGTYIVNKLHLAVVKLTDNIFLENEIRIAQGQGV